MEMKERMNAKILDWPYVIRSWKLRGWLNGQLYRKNAKNWKKEKD
jgi:hypothetical protein